MHERLYALVINHTQPTAWKLTLQIYSHFRMIYASY